MADLANWREQLDEIDAKIIDLIIQRFVITHKIGEHKSKSGLAVRDKDREKQQIKHVKDIARRQGLEEELVGRIMQAIIDESANQQERLA